MIPGVLSLTWRTNPRQIETRIESASMLYMIESADPASCADSTNRDHPGIPPEPDVQDSRRKADDTEAAQVPDHRLVGVTAL